MILGSVHDNALYTFLGKFCGTIIVSVGSVVPGVSTITSGLLQLKSILNLFGNARWPGCSSLMIAP